MYLKIFYYLLESKTDLPFSFMATYSINNEELERPLNYADEEFKNDPKSRKLLEDFLKSQKEVGGLIASFVEDNSIFDTLYLDEDEAFQFLEEVEMYENLGVICKLPSWKSKNKTKIGFGGSTRDDSVSPIEVKEFNPKMIINDIELDDDEINKIIEQSSCLIKLKNKWTYVDKEQIRITKNAIDKLKKAKTEEELTEIKEELEEEEVEIEERMWNTRVVELLKGFSLVEEIDQSTLNDCTLYDYQELSSNILVNSYNNGIGMCLSMECGCGKTLITIAMLNHLKQQGRLKKCLIVMPVSLLGNWQDEVERFAPDLKICIDHNSFKKKNARNYDILLTTYATVTKRPRLIEKEWDIVILDEAQNIKNPSVKQTIEIKKIKANWRLAITATPLENNLNDIWSIVDFINPETFGGLRDFKALAKDKVKLKEYLNLFVIRKRKEDVLDLPNVNKVDVMVPMSNRQAAMYNGILNDIANKEMMVLPALIRLRQICNHPSQIIGGGFNYRESGKFLEVIRLAREISERGEKVLVFTQFTEVIPALDALLRTCFKGRGTVLTGQTTSKQRRVMINDFQKGKYDYMVLSIRAGGVGINLTEANNIIFLDEPYNPSIKYQAENRVHRIGQKKEVNIYTLITEGTVEESIHTVLQQKQQLFEDVVPSDIKKVELKIVQSLCDDIIKLGGKAS